MNCKLKGKRLLCLQCALAQRMSRTSVRAGESEYVDSDSDCLESVDSSEGSLEYDQCTKAGPGRTNGGSNLLGDGLVAAQLPGQRHLLLLAASEKHEHRGAEEKEEHGVEDREEHEAQRHEQPPDVGISAEQHEQLYGKKEAIDERQAVRHELADQRPVVE